METTTMLWLLAGILVAGGLSGLVVPALPGMILLFAGLVVAAWAESFAYIGWKTIAVLGLLTAISYIVDVMAGALGAKKFGAGRYAVIGAMAGAFTGMFFGIPGILIGPFLGAVAGELLARKDLRAAGLAGVGAWLGLVAGTAVRIAIALSMIGICVLVRFL
jgi:uncharacterized protein YqgC (DUF456 family)